MKTFYITTAIDYPNGTPHMGHAYEKIVADSYARWYKLNGYKTRFLTGTDENGQKLIESAQNVGIPTLEYVDSQVLKFKKLCQDLLISNDDFLRTTEERHAKVCSAFWTKLEEKGQIYAGTYSGNYCLACESFYTEREAPDGLCPFHHTPLKLKEEQGFFFKLSEYHEWITDYIKTHKDFVAPSSAYKEIISRLEAEPLRDLAISRPNTGWGIPVPNHPNFVMYTWFDALINYYSAIADTPEQSFWPANMHVIGKDILWFHSVIWPCMLKGMELPIHHQVYVHGMILGQDGRKMSKSLNNGVDPNDIIAKYRVESFRFYLLKAISSQGDGAFIIRDMVEKHNTELGNDFGNLIMRVVKLALKNNISQLVGTEMSQDINFVGTHKKMMSFMDKREHNKALDTLWEFIFSLNQYVNQKEPWKLKDDPLAFRQVIFNCLYGIHAVSVLVSPFMPETAHKALQPLGIQAVALNDLDFSKLSYNLTEPQALFPKIEWEEV